MDKTLLASTAAISQPQQQPTGTVKQETTIQPTLTMHRAGRREASRTVSLNSQLLCV